MENELIIIGDSQVAKCWDEIDKLVPVKYAFLNPNKYFLQIVRLVREDQILIANGDLVDSYYADYRPRGENDNNWDLFFSLINQCKGRYLLNIGNHDYRSYPHNINIWGLEGHNLARKIQKKYLSDFEYARFRFLDELKAILVNPKKFDPLEKYPNGKNYVIETANKALIFLNTGPDVFSNLKNLFDIRYLRPSCIVTPLVIGLLKDQLTFFKETIDGTRKSEIFVFLHSPPFFGIERIQPIQLPNPLNEENYKAALKKNCLDTGIFIARNHEFIRSLLDSNKNFVVITSHINTPRQYIIDRSTKILWEASMEEINEKRLNANYLKFISTPTTSEITPQIREIGYMKVGSNISRHVIKTFPTSASNVT